MKRVKSRFAKTVVSLALLTCLFIPMITAFATEEGQTPSGIPFSELEQQIDAVVAEHLDKTTPGAAIVVVHNGAVIFSKGYGYADIEQHTLIDPATTVFTYASVGKLFVWVSAMQLVERGLLDLDTDITTYLPDDFSRKLNLKYTITMRDLINHSAGFEQVALNIGFDKQSSQTLPDLGDVLLDANPRQQVFKPRTISAYSNYGVALAAYVIENITGQGYNVYERENIFTPIGMINALNLPDRLNNQSILQHTAVNYAPDAEGGFTKNPVNIELAIWPAGSVNGTPEELAKFAIALTPELGQPGLLFNNSDSLASMFTPSSLDPTYNPGTHHGFWRYNGASSAFGHAGHSYHFTNFAVVPEERFGFLSISNGNEDVNVAITHLLLGHGSSQVNVESVNLPSASMVEGYFNLGQGVIKNSFLLPIVNLTPPDTVTAIDENTIELNTLMFGSARYRQIAPYVFQIISPEENPGLALYFNTLRFQMENDNPTQIHIGDGKDFLHAADRSGFGSLVSFGVSTLFFLIFPVVLLITFLIGRKKNVERTRFHSLSSCFLFSGSLLVLNNLIFLVRFIMISMTTPPTTAAFTIHIWINYIIAGLSLALFILSCVQLQKLKAQIRARRKVLFLITTFLYITLILILISWNFFVPL